MNLDELTLTKSNLEKHAERMREHLFSAKLGGIDESVMSYIKRELLMTEKKIDKINEMLEELLLEN